MPVRVLAALIISASLIISPSAAAAELPNIVFILADDLGYGDIEAFGGDLCSIDTLHFDALCREGMRITDAHVTDSHCIPSRTSIMTGRSAFRFGARPNDYGFDESFILTDKSQQPGVPHTYRVIAVNTVGLRSPESPAQAPR